DGDAAEVDRLQAELLGQRVAQRRLRHEAELHQQPADRDMLLRLLEQRDAQLVLGEDALVDQDLAEVALRLRVGGRIHSDTMIRVALCAAVCVFPRLTKSLSAQARWRAAAPP